MKQHSPEYINEVDDAARYIGKYLTRWGRIFVSQTKEKFGEARVYIHWGWSTGWLMNHLFYPNYHFYQFSRQIRDIDYKIPTDLINPVLIPYQRWIYRRAYRSAIRKWPHLREALLNGADWPEYLRGL